MVTKPKERPEPSTDSKGRMARLEQIGPLIEQTQDRLDSLFAERLDHFEALDADPGITQAEIARRAGVTPMAVSFQLFKLRKRRAEAEAG